MSRQGFLGDLLRTAGVQGFQLLAGLLALLMTARLLGPEGRGSLGALLAWAGLFAAAGSLSLESVLLRVAYRLGGQLPEFPDGRYRLDAWPDFGVLPSLVGVLRVTKLLTSNNTRSLSELRASEVDKATQIELNVCLWAFAAADLLRDAGAVQTTVAPLRRTPRVEEGLLSSLARRFGLWRGQ